MNHLEDEIRSIVAGMDNQEQGEQQNQPIEDVYIFVVRETEVEEEDQSNIVESAPATATFDVAPVTPQLTKTSYLPAYAICSLFLFLIIASITFQMYEALNPPIATVTINPKSQTLTLSGTLQLGRVLPPLMLSQSETVPATGKGHQDARNATGYITFYNGQMNSIFIPAGLLLTGNDGAQIVTDQDASIPASNLPQVGQVTVSAHAINPGSNGNIAAYDINQGCCATAIKVVNTNSFYGGVDQRDFSTVSTQDITKISTSLKSSLVLSIQGALTAQLRQSETLVSLPCSPTVTPNHNVGDEAIQVKVTVSLTCSGIAYNTKELENKATALLTTKALSKLSGYSLFGDIQTKVLQASVSHPNLVFLSIKTTGTWIYGLSPTAQEQIKHLIAGKTRQQAITLLASSKGIEQAAIQLTGFGDDTRLPKNTGYIHLTIFVV